MTSHELARALMQLSKILRSAPDQPLHELEIRKVGVRKPSSQLDAAVGLTTLLDLSRFDRSEWIRLIEEHRFPIKYSSKDSSRNIIGKLVAFLERNPDALEVLRHSTRRRAASTSASPELMRAFSVLLGDR